MKGQQAFDKIIKKKLEQGGPIPSKPNFAAIADQVAKPRKKRIGFWIPMSIAASILIAVGSFVFINQNNKSNIIAQNEITPLPAQEESMVEQEQEMDSPEEQEVMGIKDEYTPQSTPKNNLRTKPYTAHKTRNQTMVYQSPASNATTSFEEEKAEETTNPLREEKQETIIVQQEREREGDLQQRWNDFNASIQKEPLDIAADFDDPKFILGVSGGVNYGNINSGYAVALSARHDFNDKLYIDGNMGLVYNNANTQEVIGLPSNLTHITQSAIPVKSAMNRKSVTHMPNANTMYLQFNPQLGYKIFDFLSVSTGPDIQKMLNVGANQNNEFNYYTFNRDGTISQLPDVDLGFNTQTEIKISEHLKAAVIYRMGVNQLLQNDLGLKYGNRNYFQFQFKYAFGF